LARAASQNLSGQGCPAKNEAGRAKILPKRSEPRWGEQAVLREARLGSRFNKLI